MSTRVNWPSCSSAKVGKPCPPTLAKKCATVLDMVLDVGFIKCLLERLRFKAGLCGEFQQNRFVSDALTFHVMSRLQTPQQR